MGTTQSAIARLESGAQLPSLKTLLRFAKATDSRPGPNSPW
jgi:transcriptional regulator with XRE-family HTH domain